MSQVSKIAQLMEEQKHLLQGITGIAKDSQNELLFENAMQWAEKHIGIRQDVNWISQQPEFWGWWMNEWYRLGVHFLANVHYNTNTNEWYCWKIDNKNQFHYISGKDALSEFYQQFMNARLENGLKTNSVLYRSFHENLIKQ